MKNDAFETGLVDLEVAGEQQRESTPPRKIVGHSARLSKTKNGRPSLLLFEVQEGGTVRIAISLLIDDGPIKNSKFATSRERSLSMLDEAGLLRDETFDGPAWAGGEFLLYEEEDEYEGRTRVTGRWLLPMGNTAPISLEI